MGCPAVHLRCLGWVRLSRIGECVAQGASNTYVPVYCMCRMCRVILVGQSASCRTVEYFLRAAKIIAVPRTFATRALARPRTGTRRPVAPPVVMCPTAMGSVLSAPFLRSTHGASFVRKEIQHPNHQGPDRSIGHIYEHSGGLGAVPAGFPSVNSSSSVNWPAALT
jgi:hypothetical protein